MENKEKTSTYQQALAVFAKISGWVAGPVIIALLAGKYLDERYQTKPWLFLSLTGLAFVISIVGLVKEATIYIKQISKSSVVRPDSSGKALPPALKSYGRAGRMTTSENQEINNDGK